MTGVSNHSNSLSLYSSRPGRPPKRASVGLSLAASHLAAAAGHHPQHSLKKHRMDNGDYYENGHLGKFTQGRINKQLKKKNIITITWNIFFIHLQYNRRQIFRIERLLEPRFSDLRAQDPESAVYADNRAHTLKCTCVQRRPRV